MVRGPASVLYGQAQPGGFVNIIAKKPSAQRSEEILLKATTYDGGGLGLTDAGGYDYAVDLTGPIDSAGMFLYRLVAENNDTNTFRDYTYTRGPYIAPSLTWNITDATTATLLTEYRRTVTSWDKGLVVPGRNIDLVAPITTYYQQPGDVQKERGTSETLDLEHRFEDGFKLRASVRNVDSKDQTYGFDNAGIRPDLLQVARRATQQFNTRTSTFWDVNAVLPFDTGFIGHRAIVGVNGGRDTLEANRAQYFSGPATGPQSLDINLYNPVYTNTPSLSSLPLVNVPTPNPSPQSERYTSSKALGAYTSDLMTLAEHWKLNVGVRYAYEGQEITDQRFASFTPVHKTAQKALPLAGVLYQPTKEWTFYTSYSTSFVPAAPDAVDIHGTNPFEPQTSWQVELGTKADLLDDRLQTTLAVYEINKDKTLSTFACIYGICSQQIGAERARGVELEVNVQPLPNWQIAAGAARANPIVVASKDPVQVGTQLVNAARDNEHVWTRYDLASGPLTGIGFGGGVAYSGGRAGNTPTTANPGVIRLPSFVVADLGLYYVISAYELTLKVGNVFDKRYYEATGPTPDVQLQPGAPRNLSLSLRAHF